MSGYIEKNFDIKILTTFKIGGKIKEVYFSQTVDKFCEYLKKYGNDAKVFGNLSNTLISSEGYGGQIILTTKMDKVLISGTSVIADAGVKGPKLAQLAAEKGLSGFEFMIGFPGSVGGEVWMNASANGQSISDTLVCATCYSAKTGVVKLSKDELKFGYRTSRCQEDDLIVLQAEFELSKKRQKYVQT